MSDSLNSSERWAGQRRCSYRVCYIQTRISITTDWEMTKTCNVQLSPLGHSLFVLKYLHGFAVLGSAESESDNKSVETVTYFCTSWCLICSVHWSSGSHFSTLLLEKNNKSPLHPMKGPEHRIASAMHKPDIAKLCSSSITWTCDCAYCVCALGTGGPRWRWWNRRSHVGNQRSWLRPH